MYVVDCYINGQYNRQYGPFHTEDEATNYGESFLTDYSHLTYTCDVTYTIRSVTLT